MRKHRKKSPWEAEDWNRKQLRQDRARHKAERAIKQATVCTGTVSVLETTTTVPFVPMGVSWWYAPPEDQSALDELNAIQVKWEAFMREKDEQCHQLTFSEILARTVGNYEGLESWSQ